MESLLIGKGDACRCVSDPVRVGVAQEESLKHIDEPGMPGKTIPDRLCVGGKER
jgi:hypothetical protein